MYQQIEKKNNEVFVKWKSSEDFWKIWVKFDILEKKKKLTNSSNKDDFYFTIILDLFSIMQMINVEFAGNLLIKSIAPVYIKNVSETS